MGHRTFDELNDLVNQAIRINDAATLEHCATELEEIESTRALAVAFNARGVARAMHNIGNVYQVAGNSALAMEHYQASLALNEKLGHRKGIASAIGSIGDVPMSSGKTELALEHYRRADDLCSDLSDNRGLAWNYGRIMTVLLDTGVLVEAESTLAVLDGIPVDDPRAGVFREVSRARLHELRGHLDDAVATLRSVMATASEHALVPEMSVIHKQMRDLALKRNDLAVYIEHNSEYTRITEEINGKDAATKIAMQTKRRVIDAERKETEKFMAVLHSTLPKEVTERVARGEVVNDHFENATVIFLDIVGFTEISSSMASQEVISLLDEVFTQCDTICAKHGVTKVKTIGDSYMCVSFDSVINSALCALEMSRIRLSHEMSHSVSHSVSHKVSHAVSHNVSHESVPQSELVTRNSSLVTTPRGSVDIKGKGLMQTYWLETT